MKIAAIICAICLAVVTVIAIQQNTTNSNKITDLKAQLEKSRQDGKTGAEKAFKAGVNACTSDDIAIFEERADLFDRKADNASTVLDYYLRLYVKRIYTNLAKNWGYSDDTLDEMYHDFTKVEVSYQ